MGRILLLAVFCAVPALAGAQEPLAPAAAPQSATEAAPLPDIGKLLLDVERNQKAAEAARKDYTYHVHFEQTELDGKGNVKKTTVTDSESVTINGVRVDRVVARDGKPLTAEEAAKESERIDKEVAKDKERREKREGKGQETDSRGDQIISASRILELGTFSNPRRVELDGRSTIVADYAGDPNAKTRQTAEGIIRDLVGTVWIDEKGRALVRAEGHFRNDYKIGGGLVADVRKDSSFSARFVRINDEVWLPAAIEGQGRVRVLLVSGFNGRIHMTASDYRKFRTNSTIVSSSDAIAPDAKPAPEP